MTVLMRTSVRDFSDSSNEGSQYEVVFLRAHCVLWKYKGNTCTSKELAANTSLTGP